jgi:hypothetical protein
MPLDCFTEVVMQAGDLFVVGSQGDEVGVIPWAEGVDFPGNPTGA